MLGKRDLGKAIVKWISQGMQTMAIEFGAAELRGDFSEIEQKMRLGLTFVIEAQPYLSAVPMPTGLEAVCLKACAHYPTLFDHFQRELRDVLNGLLAKGCFEDWRETRAWKLLKQLVTSDSRLVPPVIYAVMESSRKLAVGPIAVVSLMMWTLLQKEFDPIKQPEEYRRLAFTAPFCAGITHAALGFLWFLVEFLSHAATVGFMAGAAILIALQQLRGFLGIKHLTKKADIISVMHSVSTTLHHGWDWCTIVIGVSFLVFLLVAKYIGKRSRRLFCVSAIAPLVFLTVSTFFVYISHANKHGVQIVGNIPKDVNPSLVDEIYFAGNYLAKGFKIGLVVEIIALTDEEDVKVIGRLFADIGDSYVKLIATAFQGDQAIFLGRY